MTELREHHIDLEERRQLLRLFILRREQIEAASCWVDGELEALMHGINRFASVLPPDEVTDIYRDALHTTNAT